MKKAFTTLSLLALTYVVMAGGIVHNTNQSASFIRMPSRDASLGIDAVYYNPAGLTQLRDGIHFSLSNQYITQLRTINSTFPTLNRTEYEGGVTAPLFPSVYGVYKMGKWAFSAGVNPIGGGGSASYEKGLPSFEYELSTLVPMLQGQLAPLDQAIQSMTGADPGFRNITGYNVDLNFDGSSVFWGIQLGASYELTDKISVFLGGRYIIANNTYTGYLKNYTIDAPEAYGGTQKPGDYLRFIAGQIQPFDPTNAAVLNGTASVLDERTANLEVDDEQTGSGFAPIVGVNFMLTDNFNIGIKYEHKAAINLKHKTGKADLQFPDETELSSDMPSMLSLGASFAPIGSLRLNGGFHYYIDRAADYGKVKSDQIVDEVRIIEFYGGNKELIDNNFWEAAFGVEYDINDQFLVSAGYLRTQTGVNDKYHSDLSHSLSTNSVGTGLRYAITSSVAVNLGAMFTFYEPFTKEFPAVQQMPPYKEEYKRTATTFAIGIDVSL